MINSTQMLVFPKLSPTQKTEGKELQKTEEKNQHKEAYSSEYSAASRSVALAGINIKTPPSRVTGEKNEFVEVTLDDFSSKELKELKDFKYDISALNLDNEDSNSVDDYSIVYDKAITLSIDELDVTVKESLTGEEVNNWWLTEMDYENPPYLPKSKVQQIELNAETKFSRVYDGENSGMYGGWVMKSSDIEGLTPEEIQDKFALPQKPLKVCDVILPKGTQMRVGFCNPLEGWGKGGGLQFDLMGQKVGEFCNERDLPN